MSSRIIILSIVVILCLISVFKNISYPLFWADESMTVVGGERTLIYGYPKVHDGKNVLYDIRHPNTKLGINERTDAFVGNANWAMYYIAAIGVKIAAYFDDIYTKTGIIRSIFAALGVLGILIFGLNSSMFVKDINTRLLFLIIYFVMILLSTSLTLHIREARYYSVLLLSSASIIWLFTTHHILKRINPWTYNILLTLNLIFLFFSFPPASLMFYIVAAIYLGSGCVNRIISNCEAKKELSHDLKVIGPEILKYAGPYVIGLMLIAPLMHFFKTFEIANAMALYNGYGPAMYVFNLSTIWNYFTNYDYIYAAILLKVLTLVLFRRILNDEESLMKFKMSSFLSIFFVGHVLSVAKIPNYIFIRYFINLQPVLLCMALLDIFILISIMREYSPRTRMLLRTSTLVVVGLLVCNPILKNKEFIMGHYYEITHRYKGCLDYVVEYLKKNVHDPEELILATNYEETSYMYYLRSKVTIGFVKNNLEEDLKYQPDIIVYRRGWDWLHDQDIFLQLLQKMEYVPVYFPIVDYSVNNIPELRENKQALRHQFKTLVTDRVEDQLIMLVRKDKAAMFPAPRYDKGGNLL